MTQNVNHLCSFNQTELNDLACFPWIRLVELKSIVGWYGLSFWGAQHSDEHIRDVCDCTSSCSPLSSASALEVELII